MPDCLQDLADSIFLISYERAGKNSYSILKEQEQWYARAWSKSHQWRRLIPFFGGNFPLILVKIYWDKSLLAFTISFYFLRATFLVAEACLIAGATKNAYHTQYRGMIYAQNLSCETLRKGVFIAGAVFVVATMILNIYYYMYFTKAVADPPSHKANRSGSNIGMTGYAWERVHDHSEIFLSYIKIRVICKIGKMSRQNKVWGSCILDCDHIYGAATGCDACLECWSVFITLFQVFICMEVAGLKMEKKRLKFVCDGN